MSICVFMHVLSQLVHPDREFDQESVLNQLFDAFNQINNQQSMPL